MSLHATLSRSATLYNRQLNLTTMSISADQAVDAAMFLTIYRQAIHTLNESAIRDSDNETIEDFTDRINRVYDNKIFRRICNPRDPIIKLQNSWKYMELVKDVRAFQFSHYIFLKYLPNFINFHGNATDMLFYLKAQNAQLQNDILH